MALTTPHDPAACPAIALPSHDEALYGVLSGDSPDFESVCATLDVHLAAGASLTIDHLIGRANVHLLADFVRFVDQRFPGLACLRFDLDRDDAPDAGTLATAWTCATAACMTRRVPCDVVRGCGLTLPEGLELAPLRRAGSWSAEGAAGASGRSDVARVSLAEGPADMGLKVHRLLAQTGWLERIRQPASSSGPVCVHLDLTCHSSREPLDPTARLELLTAIAASGARELRLAQVGGESIDELTALVGAARESGLHVHMSVDERGPAPEHIAALATSGLAALHLQLPDGDAPTAHATKMAAAATKAGLGACCQ